MAIMSGMTLSIIMSGSHSHPVHKYNYNLRVMFDLKNYYSVGIKILNMYDWNLDYKVRVKV